MTPLGHPALADQPGVTHGFFTRKGGVSEGIYASLNCGLGSRDEPGLVQKNRALVAEALGVKAHLLATPYQMHGTGVAYVGSESEKDTRHQADALVTDRPEIAVAIGTADCGPILLCDVEAGVVAAAHAGWRGALAGIVETTLEAMVMRGANPARTIAILGPTISQANYEVGQDMMSTIMADDRANERWLRPSKRNGHAMFDLPGFIVERLKRAGVARAEAMNLCTYADPARFFSYRRATHRGEPDYGRMLAAISLKP